QRIVAYFFWTPAVNKCCSHRPVAGLRRRACHPKRRATGPCPQRLTNGFWPLPLAAAYSASASAATADREVARVNWTRGCELAGIKMERLDVDHSHIQIGIGLQKLSQRWHRYIAAARKRNVRMPGAKLRLDANCECGFLHAFVNLK